MTKPSKKSQQWASAGFVKKESFVADRPDSLNEVAMRRDWQVAMSSLIFLSNHGASLDTAGTDLDQVERIRSSRQEPQLDVQQPVVKYMRTALNSSWR